MHKQYPARVRLSMHWYHAHAQIEAVAEATSLIVTSGTNFVCNGDVFTLHALLERCYRSTDRYDKVQISPLALLEAQ